MLDFIKGSGTQEYRQLLSLKPEYNEAIFLDTEDNRLYYAGNPLDVRVEVEEVLDDQNMVHQEYHFTNPDGETVTIDDVLIPGISGYTIQLHDVSSGAAYDYHCGLMSGRDKFMLEAMAKLLGITINYTYWATVHHYSDVLNNRYEELTEVKVYKNEDDEWQYDYDEFPWDFYNTGTETAYIHVTVPAGSVLLKDNGIYELPKKVIIEGGTLPVTGDPINIGDVEGKDEIATVRALTLTLDRQAKDFNFFDGGGRSGDTSTLFQVGAMPAGVTVDELEHETVSEVVARILFPEDAHYEKVCDTSIYIKFTDEYINTYGEGDYIKIGSKYPSVDELETVFIPETWQLYAGGQPIGDPVYATEYVKTDYFINDGQHLGLDPHGDPDDPSIYPVDDNPTSEYNEHLTKFAVGGLPHYCDGNLDHTTYSEHDKSVYFGEVYFDVIDISTGQVIDSSVRTTDNYIGFEGYKSTHPDYEGTDSSFINSLIAGWPLLSNAPEVSVKSNWDRRNLEPEDDFNPNDIREWGLGIPEKTYYLKWPSATPAEQKFCIYMPDGGEIKSCGGAHDGANEEYSAEQGARIELNPDSSEGTYELGYWATGVPDVYVTHEFFRWVVDKAAVITNVKITIGKKEE